MKRLRVRISTLMLLVVIAGLAAAVGVQQRRLAQNAAERAAERKLYEAQLKQARLSATKAFIGESTAKSRLESELVRQKHSSGPSPLKRSSDDVLRAWIEDTQWVTPKSTERTSP